MTQIRVELYETPYNRFRKAKAEMGVKTNLETLEKLLDFWFRNREEKR